MSAAEATLVAMGFDVTRAREAVAACGDDQSAAIQYCIDHSDGSASSSSGDTTRQSLIAMGFEPDHVQRALKVCGESVEECMNWLFEHPSAPQPAASCAAELELRRMGFDQARIELALRAKGNDLEAALQWLVEGDKDAAHDVPAPPPKMRKVADGKAAMSAAAAAAGAAALPHRERRLPAASAAAAAGRAPSASCSASTAMPPASNAAVRLPGVGDSRSLKRLMKELQHLTALEARGGCRSLHAFQAAPLDESDLYQWELRLFDFAKDDPIAEDLEKRRLEHLTLQMHFPHDYPNAPPFVYMVRPRLKEHTGYVLSGGGICMELLTPQGWSPATSIDALVQSVRAMLMAGKARLLSIDPAAREADYTYAGAKRDFAHILSVHGKHGWTSHPMFKNA